MWFNGKIGKWTITGLSVGGYKTSIYVHEANLCFDYGCAPPGSEIADNVLITHGHTDHIAAISTHARTRRFKRLLAPLYVMPEVCVEPFKLFMSAVSAFDRGSSDVTIYGKIKHVDVATADSCMKEPLALRNGNRNPNYYVTAVPMIHRIKAFGYCIWSKRVKLKPEYLGLSREEIVSAKKTKEISDTIYMLELAYTGDTTFAGLTKNPILFTAETLIVECTLLSDLPVKSADEFSHIHLQQLVAHQHLFKCKNIVLCHFSDRYKRHEIVKHIADAAFTDEFRKKIHLLVPPTLT